MKKQLWVSCISLLFISMASANSLVDRSSVSNPTEIWSAWGGIVEFRLQSDVLQDWELSINATGTSKGSVNFSAPLANTGSVAFHSPFGNFSGFVDGSVTLNQSFNINQNGIQTELANLRVVPIDGFPFSTFALVNAENEVMFHATNMHVYVNEPREQLVIERMDLQVGPALAEQLAMPSLNGQFLGELALTMNLNVPAGATTDVPGTMCSDRPKWPTDGFIADVGLTDMNTIQDVGTINEDGNTFELIAPSSSLENLVGLDGADVPWYTKFMGTFPPYNNDQHPYLVWNLYRVNTLGEIEQIGRSGIKHAFLTINTNCTINCQDSHILWPGCGDVYGVGNNDSDRDLGPRFEVDPLTGVFESTGSFFDPGRTGSLTNESDAPGENRMRVLREDLQTPGAQYFFESWYVIRDDSDIFNSMGYRPITPSNPGGGNGWAYAQSTFVVGPVIDQWVPPNTDPATGSQNESFFEAEAGHFKLAVRTTDLTGGQYRYTYMLMNFDVTDGLSELALNADSSSISDIGFNDADVDAANDWALPSNGDISFQASAGNQMPWGNGYTFSFIGSEPIAGQATVRLGGIGSGTTVNIDTLVPGMSEELLTDGFESLD